MACRSMSGRRRQFQAVGSDITCARAATICSKKIGSGSSISRTYSSVEGAVSPSRAEILGRDPPPAVVAGHVCELQREAREHINVEGRQERIVVAIAAQCSVAQ